MATTVTNGIDVAGLSLFKRAAESDPTKADRQPIVVAHWAGGSRARVEYDQIVTSIGGEGELNAMQMLLAAFVACDVDLVAMHAAMIGVELKSLSVEATGHFNVSSYLGIADAPGSGYDDIAYRVRVRAPGITSEQIAYLQERCERSSPVGDSLTRMIPLTLEIQSEEDPA